MLNVPKSFTTVSLWIIWHPETSVCILADWMSRTSLHISSDIFLFENVQNKKPKYSLSSGPCVPHGLGLLCWRVEAMFRALWRHQCVSSELCNQGTPFKELCVGIVDACMLSPAMGLWMALGFHTKTWCHDAGCGLYWACAARREARLDLQAGHQLAVHQNANMLTNISCCDLPMVRWCQSLPARRSFERQEVTEILLCSHFINVIQLKSCI